ncbi:MAG: hypothetical protein ABI442_20380 [Gemmatimonadaceae bacterium]
MKRLVSAGLTIGAVALAACSDKTTTTTPSSLLAVSMVSAYSATPAGFSELSSSFASSSSDGAFMPGFDMGGGGDHHGFGPPGGGPGFGLGFMGGGLFGPFLGDGVGPFFHDNSSCTFAASTGLVTCGPTTRDGLTVTRVSRYTTTGGAAQSKQDSTTNTVVTTATVTGTTTRRDSTTSVVNESSNQTLTGLAKGSTQRTVNGMSASTESSTGTSKQGAFTSKRTAGDTVTGVVIPVPAVTTTTTHVETYPTAGTVIRGMTATVTITGQSPATSSRREVVTYDGSATAKVVITQDGTTQNCTLPLPHGKLTCG